LPEIVVALVRDDKAADLVRRRATTACTPAGRTATLDA
jgi:hypothetical protein